MASIYFLPGRFCNEFLEDRDGFCHEVRCIRDKEGSEVDSVVVDYFDDTVSKHKKLYREVKSQKGDSNCCELETSVFQWKKLK